MRMFACRMVLAAATLSLGFTEGSKAQIPLPANPQPPIPASATPPAAPPNAFAKTDYLPACSTEKVNGNCFVNIDRRYPISMPTYQMRPGTHIAVYVFHPFPFESLTLDAGAALAYEGSDQAAGFLNALIPTLGKGVTLGTAEPMVSANKTEPFVLTTRTLDIRLENAAPGPEELAKEILGQITELDRLLDQALDPVTQYIARTKIIYAQVREIELAAPRPTDRSNQTFRAAGVPAPGTPDPWAHYPEWRAYMRDRLTKQGSETTTLLARLPESCQGPGPAPAGPWAPAVRPCSAAAAGGTPPPTGTTVVSSNPLRIPAGYDNLYVQMQAKFATLNLNEPDPDTYQKILTLKSELDARHQRVSDALTYAVDLLPTLITKISTDMQTTFANIVLTQDATDDPYFVGVIPPPGSLIYRKDENTLLTPNKYLGPQITFTLNAQNEIANSLFTLPSATQKQAVASITALYAAPRFEVSAGAFFSWLPNPTFANKTDVVVTNGIPTPVDVKIDMTKTIGPLIIPFTAANYRISPEYNWIGGRRSAFYATLGLGLNPYNSQVEYVGGLSFSWRYLMFSPLYHVGHGIHLTQGEQVGQVWCQYGAAAGSTPPPCGGSPPAPSTTNFWRGAFALGISVRVPTTYSATNH